MKKLLLAFSVFAFANTAYSQNVSITSDSSAPDPSAMLDVKSTSRGMLIPRMSTTQRQAIASPAQGLLVFDNNANTFWYFDSANWIELVTSAVGNSKWTQNGTDIYNNNTGKVGIGTNVPGDKLTVLSPPNSYGITHSDGTIRLSTFVGGSAGGAWLGTQSNHPFHIYTNNGSAHATFNTNSTTDFKGTKSAISLYDGASQAGNLKADVRNLEISARKISQPAVTLPGHLIFQVDEPGNPPLIPNQTSGNVGIGTRFPTEKLTVETPYNTEGISHVSENGGGGRIRLSTRMGGVSAVIGTFSNHIFRLVSNGISQMHIYPDGNVSIGTDNAVGYKLSVNGSIRSKEVVVESGWADYVFDKSYKLRPINELENFINLNKHLPNIPSADEISKKGLHLGDVQKRMMEKIEEMSLYIIELNKKIEKLEEINGQRKN